DHFTALLPSSKAVSIPFGVTPVPSISSPWNTVYCKGPTRSMRPRGKHSQNGLSSLAATFQVSAKSTDAYCRHASACESLPKSSHEKEYSRHRVGNRIT